MQEAIGGGDGPPGTSFASQPTFGDAEIEAVRETLDSGWVAGQGPRSADLERRFAEKCGVGGRWRCRTAPPRSTWR